MCQLVHTLRYHLAMLLFNLAARLYPLTGKDISYAHEVGNCWLEFRLTNGDMPWCDWCQCWHMPTAEHIKIRIQENSNA